MGGHARHPRDLATHTLVPGSFQLHNPGSLHSTSVLPSQHVNSFQRISLASENPNTSQVRNIPITDEVKEEHIKKLVETIRSLKVRSINFDDRPSERIMGRRSALVRLQPPPLPWKKERPADEEEVRPWMPTLAH